MKQKNKKAEKLLSIWWFFVLGVIGGGIVIGVLIYSSADVNVNEIEAEVLGERIINCIVDIDILDECKLDKKMFGKPSDFYLNISIYVGDDLFYDFSAGDFSFEDSCKISMSEDVKTKYFPKCVVKKENLLSFEGEKLELILLTASKQKGKKGVF